MAEESKKQVESEKSPTDSNQSKANAKAGSQTDIIALSKALDKQKKLVKELQEQLADRGESETPAGGGDLFGDGTEKFQKEITKLKGSVKQRDSDVHRLNLENKALKVSQQYGVPLEALEGEENPEAKVLEILAEVAEKEAKEEEEKGESPESKPIYEIGASSTTGKKKPSDMNDEEFKKYAEDVERKYNLEH